MSLAIHTPLRARLSALAAALLVAFGVALAAASPAQAHDDLIGSDPAAGAALDALPAQLTLTFSAGIAADEGASVVEVTDAAGTTLVDGSPSVSDNVLTQPLAGEASGAVTVLWKVVSSDGHPISGEYSFTVAAAAPTPTETATPAPTETAAPDETPAPSTAPTVAPEDAAADAAAVWPWVLFGLIAAAAAGVVVYLLVARGRRDGRPGEAGDGAAGGASGPGSEPPAAH
ncbi:copper resistance protein CopC [Microbacterium sp. NPDC056736]|uniref:copper resistance CopC family protein n=1 Tax=Microbacterium sp. NPDC056736 TaxID=3345932 RepID=UPI00366A5D1E